QIPGSLSIPIFRAFSTMIRKYNVQKTFAHLSLEPKSRRGPLFHIFNCSLYISIPSCDERSNSYDRDDREQLRGKKRSVIRFLFCFVPFALVHWLEYNSSIADSMESNRIRESHAI